MDVDDTERAITQVADDQPRPLRIQCYRAWRVSDWDDMPHDTTVGIKDADAVVVEVCDKPVTGLRINDHCTGSETDVYCM